MALSLWWLRSPQEKFDPDEEYRGHPKVFSMKFNYGGRFTKPPGRTYVDGKVGFFDMVDSFELGFHELESMTDCLDLHVGDERLYYYFKVPNSDLDNGLRALTNDTDLDELFKYVEEFKVIEIYTELGSQAIGTTETINESQVSQVDNEVRTKDHIDEDDNGDGEGGDEDNTKDGESGDEDNNGDGESSDEDDSDFLVDSDNSCDDLEVDMNEFRSMVDIPVNEERQHFTSEDDNSDVEVDLDDFDSMDEDETPLSKAIKKARKKNRKGKDPMFAPFYVGQQFSNRDEVRDLVKKFCIESRRQFTLKRMIMKE